MRMNRAGHWRRSGTRRLDIRMRIGNYGGAGTADAQVTRATPATQASEERA